MLQIAKVLAFAVILSTATKTLIAETVRVPLLELLGDYTIDSFGDGPFGRQIQVTPAISHFGSERATIELRGSITHGRVRGDGVLRQSRETILDGGFNASFQSTRDPLSLDLGLRLLPQGEFQRDWSFSVFFQPGIDDFPVIGETKDFRPTVSVSFGPSWGRLYDEIPFLRPPAHGERRRAEDGLIIVEPVVGTITEAYLVIEHRFIPEPSTLAIVGSAFFVGALGLLGYRLRRLRGNQNAALTC
jgi:hypothetical protein